jgi:trans-2,3-dihydro-3-hydroxyanthranilate isomerase
LPFFIVDVFAERKYQGNPLAVVLQAGGLGGETMQAIAREMNYSETTFLVAGEPDRLRFRVRIFTPEEEIPFAGHPVLGTAFIIRREVLGRPVDRLVLDLPVGAVPVSIQDEDGLSGFLWMEQPSPVFGEAVEAAPVAEALGLGREDLDERFPVQAVSTGLPFLIAPLGSLEAVQRAAVDPLRLARLVEGREAKNLLIFARQACEPGHDLHVRVFVPFLGIPEDPATGSGNGCLAAYLVKHRCLGSDRIDLRAEQGYEMQRPSLLALRAHAAGAGGGGERIAVSVGGRVIPVARGELL